jgi:hypothetical protein
MCPKKIMPFNSMPNSITVSQLMVALDVRIASAALSISTDRIAVRRIQNPPT